MMRSAEEWLISLSCHRATFSREVRAYPRTNLARPHVRSQSSGFFLWGMADDPVCPELKGSDTSETSVCCNPRSPRANFSRELMLRARVVTN